MLRDNYQILLEILKRTPQIDYPQHSRIHPLRTFPQNCFVKRDDELGFSITGTKVRKFRSLIPYLLQQNVTDAVVIGGGHSNNVLGITQLLIENEVNPILFLRGAPSDAPQGTELFIRLLVRAQSIHWVPRNQWNRVETFANACADQLQSEGKQSIVIPEGSSLPASLPGATTLALDILRNETEQKVNFNHLFMDVGTGLSAAATMLAFVYLKKELKIHLVLLAGREIHFVKTLKHYHEIFQEWLCCPVPLPENFEMHYPSTARSFGSINQRVMRSIHSLAQQEGFLTDPIYSAKLFLTAKEVIEKQNLTGNILLVHSGGGMALQGYSHLQQACIRSEGNDGR